MERYQLIERRQYPVQDAEQKRTYEDIILKCGDKGEAHFTLSLPESLPSKGLPCILIVGGLQTGRESLQFVPEHGDHALVAYEYPETLQHLTKVKVLWKLNGVRRAALEVPYQLLAIIEYLHQQHWNSGESINMMGYSFGSIFIPITYVNAEKEKMMLGPGVMAYGGAGIHCLFKANLPLPRFLKGPVASLAAAVFKSIDPLIYAPKIKGEFLLINGIHDVQIPIQCAHCLQDLVPEPKTVINLETDHMHPDNTELTMRLINISRTWLEQRRENPA